MGNEGTRRLFGTDGIRGVANRDPMTAEVALRLGRAVARRFQHPSRPGRIVIGKDTRLSGYMLESALQARIDQVMKAIPGVVISASHNPYQDNGIKLFAADGFKLPDDVELALEREMEQELQGLPGQADDRGSEPADIGT